MFDEYTNAQKQGKKEYKAKAAAGEYPYLPALDSLVPNADTRVHQPLGLMEIPVGLIAGTKTQFRQNSFAPDFMPLLEENSEFAFKWTDLYRAQISEGFRDPIKVYEYLHRFYVQEGNKRVSVSRALDIPNIMADVTRLMPPADVLAQHPEYAEFLKFYNVSHIYEIDCSWKGAYSEIAELMKENERYQRTVSLEDMIAETFRKPKEGEGRWWGTTEIITLLSNRYAYFDAKRTTSSVLGRTINNYRFSFKSRYVNGLAEYWLCEKENGLP